MPHSCSNTEWYLISTQCLIISEFTHRGSHRRKYTLIIEILGTEFWAWFFIRAWCYFSIKIGWSLFLCAFFHSFFFEKCWCVKLHFPSLAHLPVGFISIYFPGLLWVAEKPSWWAVLPQYSWCWKGNRSSVRTMLRKICETQLNTPRAWMKGQALLTAALTVREETEKPHSPSAENVPGWMGQV